MARFLRNIVSIEKGDIRTMSIRCMPASPCIVPGALLFGDALNMRHAITRGGMTVALHDVAIIHTLFTSLDIHDTSAVIKFTHQFYNM
ncbi:hypothetical protein ACS0TY_001957 [Phlomoides rotata]